MNQSTDPQSGHSRPSSDGHVTSTLLTDEQREFATILGQLLASEALNQDTDGSVCESSAEK